MTKNKASVGLKNLRFGTSLVSLFRLIFKSSKPAKLSTGMVEQSGRHDTQHNVIKHNDN
jgi:hypothetical protein